MGRLCYQAYPYPGCQVEDAIAPFHEWAEEGAIEHRTGDDLQMLVIGMRREVVQAARAQVIDDDDPVAQ